jgi:hypothetical protein
MTDVLDAAPEVTWEKVQQLERSSRALRALASFGEVVGFANVFHPQNFRAVMAGATIGMTRRLQARRAQFPGAVDIVNIVRNPLPYYAIDDYFEGVFEGIVAGVKGLDPRSVPDFIAKLPSTIVRLRDASLSSQFFQLGLEAGEKLADEGIQVARDPEARARRMGYLVGLLIFEAILARGIGLAVKGIRRATGTLARALERTTVGQRATGDRLAHARAPEQARGVPQAARATRAEPLPEPSGIHKAKPAAKGPAPAPPKTAENQPHWWKREGPRRTAGTRLKAALDKLRRRGVNVDDPYTLEKLDQIYAKYDDPLSLLSAARADIGEVRILVMQAKRPGVKRVRFLKPRQGKVTPDVEVTLGDGTEFVEVRTVTEAHQKETLSSKGRFVKSRTWLDWAENEIREKIDHGQISSNHPGALVVHFPFQRASGVSLEGWRDVLKRLRAKPFPAGLRRIEISTPAQTNIYEAPNWLGRIVKTP